MSNEATATRTRNAGKPPKYAWPTEVGQAVTIKSASAPNSFRVTASQRGKRYGHKLSVHALESRSSDAGLFRYTVTRVG